MPRASIELSSLPLVPICDYLVQLAEKLVVGVALFVVLLGEAVVRAGVNPLLLQPFPFLICTPQTCLFQVVRLVPAIHLIFARPMEVLERSIELLGGSQVR